MQSILGLVAIYVGPLLAGLIGCWLGVICLHECENRSVKAGYEVKAGSTIIRVSPCDEVATRFAFLLRWVWDDSMASMSMASMSL
jgi:hypothetical protein